MQRLYGWGFSLYWYGKGNMRGLCEEYAKGFIPRMDVAPLQGLVAAESPSYGQGQAGGE